LKVMKAVSRLADFRTGVLPETHEKIDELSSSKMSSRDWRRKKARN